MDNSSLPPEFQELFGTLRKPAKELTQQQKLGLELQKLAQQFPKSKP